jgi:protein phosphatase
MGLASGEAIGTIVKLDPSCALIFRAISPRPRIVRPPDGGSPLLLTIPDPCLIALVGPSGAGKSTFAARHFQPTEVVSSDRCRGWVCDDETDQTVNSQAFAVVHAIVRARLSLARSVVVDATNVQPESRARLVELAREADLFAVAIVLDVPALVCEDRNASRPDRQFGPHVVRGQANSLRRSIGEMRREGFKQVWILKSEDIDAAEIARVPLWTDRKREPGPFDLVGDVHGCMVELRELLDRLGYRVDAEGLPTHPDGRRLVFVGDLVDRGPDSVGVLDLVRRLVSAGRGFCVAGNHDEKLLKKLRGRDVRIAHGLAETLAQIEALPAEERPLFRSRASAFLDGLVSHYVLDGGRLVVAHAGLKAEYHGRSSMRVRSFALYGDTTGEVDSFGLPVRNRWARDYRGKALVVFGHTPVREPDRLNNTINIDTGCCFGGGLTALRYPENRTVSVPARRTYAEPKRPFLDAEEPADAPDPRL